MQCSIRPRNLETFVRGLHLLSRTGKDLYLEPAEYGLRFRTVDASQSTSMSLFFKSCFFKSYESEFGTSESGMRRISMEDCLDIFDAPLNMGSRVKCEIEMRKECDNLTIRICSGLGFTNTYYLPIDDSETIQLKYNKNEMSNQLSISLQQLGYAIQCFGPNDKKLTIQLSKDKIYLKNYYEIGNDNANNMLGKKTLCLEKFKLKTYTVTEPGWIRITLGELRAVCDFSKTFGSLIRIYLEKPGIPVVFAVENKLYEADYVMSTLSPESSSVKEQCNRSQRDYVISSTITTASNINLMRKRKLVDNYEELSSSSRYSCSEIKYFCGTV